MERHLIIIQLCFLSLFGQVAAKVNPEDTATAEKFKRRAFHSVAVLKNRLYIEGGDISTYVNEERKSERPSDPVNTTLYIPLDSDWTNRTLLPKETQHADKMEAVRVFGLWADERDNGAIYRWAGQLSFSGQHMDRNQVKTLWKLETSSEDDGKGSWSATEPANPETFSKTIRTRNGASAACGGLGVYIGGVADNGTEYFESNLTQQAIPGTLIYNMDSREWTNYTSHTVLRPNGLHKMGTPVCTTKFGGNPLIFLLGGYTPPFDNGKSELRSFETVTFLDPVNKQWYEQKTTGPIPPPREYFCAVGAHGKNGTYEIFIYGGRSEDTGTQNEIYILTIPGFEWILAPTISPRRYQHACALIGKRQMISVGGLSMGQRVWESVDEWYRGIGVLDLPTLEWRDRYSADADEYDSPNLVKNFYAKGGMDKVKWWNSDVKNMFLRDDGTFKSGNSTSPVDSNGSNSRPLGAIIGGTVGGVAFIALILGGVLLWLRRRRASYAGKTKLPELTSEPSCGKAQDFISGWSTAEINDPRKTKEFTTRHEIDRIQRSELATTTMRLPPPPFVPSSSIPEAPIELEARSRPHEIPG